MSDDQRRADALKSFNAKTDAYLVDLMQDATARGFCHACALNYVLLLVLNASEVLAHDRTALTDEMPRTNFDDKPGHA
jgi:hypothetical protein